MKNKILHSRRVITDYCKDNIFFIISSLIFAIIMLNIKISGDDITLWEKSGYSPSQWWKLSWSGYYNWSSRQIVNFIWFAILHCGRVVRSLYMGLSFFVMIKALEKLFIHNESGKCRLYIVFVIMLFPFLTLTTAGWIATFATYFTPLAFGIMSFVPIKKVFNNEKIKVVEFLFYCFSLIYAANEEQMMVVVLFSYTVAIIYFVIKKNIEWKIVVLFVLAVVSAIYILTCPGNNSRSEQEQLRFFPTYGMLDFIDKADLGLSTTLRWLFFGNNVFVIVILGLFVLLIWKRYNEFSFRMISLIPFVFTLFFGPLITVISSMFPHAAYIANNIAETGAFTVENEGRGIGLLQFGFILIIVLFILIEVFLLNYTFEGVLTDYTLLISGVASRVAMGFSPTIYASSIRTFTIMIIAIISVSVHLFSENIGNITVSKNVWECLRYIMWIMIIIGAIDLIFLVNTAFYI